jgi:DNA-binding response OmpR family regulator
MDARTARSILILEDEPLIALDHDLHVGRAGFTQVTIFSSCAAAHEWLRSNTPTVALLDVRLRDGPCSEVATVLRNKGVPFVVCSGSSKEDSDPVFRHGIWVSKPCMPEDLIAALTQAKAKVASQA